MTQLLDNNIVGKRIQLIGPLVNSNSQWMPVEQDMPIGLTGTVFHANFDGPKEFHQISVRWDNGRSLGLFPTDPFVVLEDNNDIQAG
jgi:hypothetical protein